MTKQLEGKTAVIYGGGGSIGGAVAEAFVREGARVYLAGRTEAPVQAVADKLRAQGGQVDAAVVDATDETAVDAHAARVVGECGRLDISFNLAGRPDVQGQPLVEMTTADFMRAIDVGLRSAFVTARAAGRQMTQQSGGVILHLNSASGAGALAGMGNTGPADAATESLMRYLAAELGQHNIRVCGIWTAGVAETLTTEKIREVAGPEGPTAEQVIQGISMASALKRTPHLPDVAEVATFLASDRAAGISGSMVNVTAGLVLR
jgi:NAD(P)-dependent dehydrogenase (short-subunit alcohol dehydrogenase family)